MKVKTKNLFFNFIRNILFCLLVLSVGEQGYLEGRCKDMEGWFPSNHVQDVCIFSKYLFE